MKKVFSLIVLISFFGCNKSSSSIEEYDRIDLNINLNLAIDFSLQLDPTAKSSSVHDNTTDSTFENVLDDELTITFTSDPAGYSNSLTFDPADPEASISLPYGNYNWSISSSVESGTAISQRLPVYGSSSSTILINEPSVELDLVVQTDYSLITVNTDHVSSVTIEQGDESLELATKDGYFYAYLYSGAQSFTLQVTDTEGSSFSNTLESVESCKEYKYTLSYSDVNVNSLVCLCEPFEVIERFLVPSSNSCGKWTKILSSEDMPSSLNFSNINVSTQYALNKNELEFYFINPSGTLITYHIGDNFFSEQNVTFSISNMRDHIYNPTINKIQYVRAGRETVYELDLNTLESSVSFTGSSDSSHYNGIYFFNSITSQIGHYGGYGFFRSKNSMANYSEDSAGWEISIPDSSDPPYRRFWGSKRWLLPNQDNTKLLIVGGVGNQSGQQYASCQDPLVTYNNDFCFLSDIWEIDLTDFSFNEVSNFDNEGLKSIGINGFDYEKSLIVKYIGKEPINSSNQNVINDELKYFKVNSPEDGWILVEQTGDIPDISNEMNSRWSFFYEEQSNKFYFITNSGVWTLEMNCN